MIESTMYWLLSVAIAAGIAAGMIGVAQVNNRARLRLAREKNQFNATLFEMLNPLIKSIAPTPKKKEAYETEFFPPIAPHPTCEWWLEHERELNRAQYRVNMELVDERDKLKEEKKLLLEELSQWQTGKREFHTTANDNTLVTSKGTFQVGEYVAVGSKSIAKLKGWEIAPGAVGVTHAIIEMLDNGTEYHVLIEEIRKTRYGMSV